LFWRVFGVNGVTDPLPDAVTPSEICMTIECIAPTTARASEVVRTMKQYLLHFGYEGRLSTGGNLAFADPSSDPATYLLAVGGELEIGSADGKRRVVPMDGFHTGPYQPNMQDNEMIVSVRLPRNVTGGVVVHERMKLKERPNITVAVFASAVKGKVTQARVAVGSVGLVPVRFDEVDATLVGIEASTLDERLARAATLASESISLFDDANGSVEYKRHLVDHFVQKVARKAIEAVV
jgi:CO/xanthine dehydrogenase FAD-binding subunit